MHCVPLSEMLWTVIISFSCREAFVFPARKGIILNTKAKSILFNHKIHVLLQNDLS